MLWKHMPLGDHLAFEQLLISADLHSLGFLASSLVSRHLVLGFLRQVLFYFPKQFSLSEGSPWDNYSPGRTEWR